MKASWSVRPVYSPVFAHQGPARSERASSESSSMKKVSSAGPSRRPRATAAGMMASCRLALAKNPTALPAYCSLPWVLSGSRCKQLHAPVVVDGMVNDLHAASAIGGVHARLQLMHETITHPTPSPAGPVAPTPHAAIWCYGPGAGRESREQTQGRVNGLLEGRPLTCCSVILPPATYHLSCPPCRPVKRARVGLDRGARSRPVNPFRLDPSLRRTGVAFQRQ